MATFSYAAGYAFFGTYRTSARPTRYHVTVYSCEKIRMNEY
jgi:hypothetical protein